MEKQLEMFRTIIERDQGQRFDRLQWRIKHLMKGFEIQNANILDVGCGSGTYAIYLALLGAKHVVGIDPEGAGSVSGVKNAFLQRIEKLDIQNCEFMGVEFAEGLFPEGHFDLILSYNSINHLHEINSKLSHNSDAYNAYLRIFSEFFRITSIGGMLILADCSRANLFSPFCAYGLKHPLACMRQIEWNKHQVPRVWMQLCLKSGFLIHSKSWYVPSPLRNIRPLVDNWLFNFCTFSHFIIRARKPFGKS
jgi:SAM-dependent methyltransferase